MNLVAANGSKIKSYGTRQRTLKINQFKYKWRFQIADVHRCILGADFLRTNCLLVDLANSRLIRLESLSIINGIVKGVPHNVCHITKASNPNEFAKLLRGRPELVTPTFSLGSPKHGIWHYIVTHGPPVHSQARRLPPEKLIPTKEEFRILVELGIARRSNSPHSSPIHVVTKPDGTYRPCGDFRKLNCVTEDDRYPIPRIHDFTANLAGMVIFSKVDLIRGYHQVPVNPDDVPKTAVITPFGLFEFLRMPFGLKNAAQTFQRLMDSILQDLDFLFVYLDDILVASKSPEEHKRHLVLLFDRLQDHGLVIKLEKCQFGVSEIDFLGHRVNKDGIRPLPAKVKAIQTYPKPVDVKALERFIGMVNFYHCFIPHAARALKPLYQALSGGKSRPKSLEWTDDMTKGFIDTKEALANATLLQHPIQGAPTALTTDASDSALGAVLEQKVGNIWKPLAFFSRQLRKPERVYAAFDRELLGIHLAIKHFRYFLEGRNFTVFTDHMPILAALRKSTEPTSGRQARQLAAIAEATTDIRHVSGKENVVADALSRIGPTGPDQVTGEDIPKEAPGFLCNAVALGVDYSELAAAQDTDPDVQAYRTAITNLKMADVPFSGGSCTVLCDISTGSARPIVPEGWRRRIFDTVHALAHPGARTTKRLVSAKFVWHGLNKQVTDWARTCLSCQRAKIQTHVKAPLQTFAPTSHRFEHVHIDLVGPLPESQGYKYLLTIIDRFTRWPEAVPIKDIETITVAKAFNQNWVARFGVPRRMTSDRGSQFTSDVWKAMTNLLGIELHPSTAYHPQANGLVERLHRTLKTSLKARLTGPHWISELPWVLLGHRTTPKEDLNASPAELVYGSTLTVPGDFVPDSTPQAPDQRQHLRQLREKVGNLKPVPTSAHGTIKVNVPDVLTRAKFVFVRTDARKTPLQTPYEGPYAVINRSDKFFTLQMGTREDNVSIDRLKAAHVDEALPVPVAQPPRRGRPPTVHQQPFPVPVPTMPAPTPVPVPTMFTPTPVPEMATTATLPVPVPTYAEVTTRAGRTTRLPQRLRD